MIAEFATVKVATFKAYDDLRWRVGIEIEESGEGYIGKVVTGLSPAEARELAAELLDMASDAEQRAAEEVRSGE